MSRDLKNRSIALGATFALLASGFVATAPAAYAATAVGLAPTTGTNLGAFITDDFEMDVKVPSPYTVANTALKIENPDKEQLSFQITGVTGRTVSEVTIRGFSATGVEVSLSSTRFAVGAIVPDAVKSATLSVVSDPSGMAGRFTMDFSKTGQADATDITSIVIEGIKTDNDAVLVDPVFTFGMQLLDGSDAAQVYGAGNGGEVTVTAWSEIEAVPDTTTVDTATASAAATVKFYDPKGVSVIPSVKRFVDATGGVFLNDLAARAALGLAGSVRFVNSDLNLAQIDLANFDVSVKKADGTDAFSAVSLSSARKELAGTNGNDDTAGAVHMKVGVSPLQTALVYNFQVVHVSDTTRKFNSVAFNPAAGNTDRALFVSVSDSVNASQTNTTPSSGLLNGVVDTSVTLRPGTAAFTYKSRLYDTDSADRAKVASQPVVALVTAGAYMPTGTSLSVAGSTETLTAASQALIVAGLTNSDGDFSVTVTSSNPIALTGYTVQFFSLKANSTFSSELTNLTGSGANTAINATYSAATVGSAALTVTNSVLAGASVTAAATVKDSFGVVTNKSGTKDLYASVVASDDTNLKQTVAVDADGSASITFTNYLASGESDLINMYLHTGATWSTSTTNIATSVISLFNPAAISSVNVPATLSGDITYDDFITGTASATNVAPAEAAKITLSGTAADANGSGVPGAVVTVTADGMQLRKGGVGAYAQDSITFAADAAGGFSVDIWSHVVNTSGVDVTVTSDGKSATTKVKTYLPTGLNGNNLVFALDMPANVDVNKTYAIQGTLTDKWGNPVQTSGTSPTGVSIIGTGSVQINSDNTATKKNFGKDGKVTVFIRSIKDIEGPGAVTATLQGALYSATSAGTDTALSVAEVTTDVAGTVHDETSFSNEIEVNINVGDAPASTDTKVNAGSFKGYVAVYAKGYEGQRLSAKIGNDWVIVPSLASSFERIVDFTGADVDISVRIFIDRVLLETIELTTK